MRCEYSLGLIVRAMFGNFGRIGRAAGASLLLPDYLLLPWQRFPAYILDSMCRSEG